MDVNNSRDDSNIRAPTTAETITTAGNQRTLIACSCNIANSRVNDKAEATGASREAPSAGTLATAEMLAVVWTPTIAERK